jgi:hypothetical protein
MIVPVDIHDLNKPEDWKYQICLSTWGTTHSDSNEERLRVFKEAASNYAEPWRSAVQWLPDDTFIPKDTIKYWANPVIWANWNGKVTLAGDGAHPIVPFRAQGLNNALQDAHNYVQALVAVRDGKTSLTDAISAYGEEVLARGSAENKLSNMWGPVLHNWQAIMNTPMMKQGYGQTKKAEEQKEAQDETPAESSDGPATQAKNTAAIESPIEHSEKPVEVKEAHVEKPSSLEPPAPIATMAHGQYTPTEEYKSHGLVAAERPLTPAHTETSNAEEDELSRLRNENEALRRRNNLLIEKLKTIQNLAVTVQEIDIDHQT